MRRAAVLVALGVLALSAGQAPAAGEPVVRAELRLRMDDGAELAATLFRPVGVTGPTPAIVVLHGIGGTRAQVASVAEALARDGYVTLSYDARGHGASGGLFSAAGPREIADLREVRDWLAARPEVVDGRVGAWGVSYGGGQLLRALVEGVPFRAAVVAETWVDLYAALAPGNLSKSGAVLAFLSSVPAERRAPEVTAVAAVALASRRMGTVRAFAAARSSLSGLSRVSTPVLFMQGRRDFAFGLDQGLAAFRALRGPKSLYIGPFGHAPSSFPGPDIAEAGTRWTRWFERHLGSPRSRPPLGDPPRVALAADPYVATRTRNAAALPATSVARFGAGGWSRTGGLGAVSRTLGRTKRLLETFGRPTVMLRASGTMRHVVAVLKARTPAGAELTVSAGGAKVQLGRAPRTITLRLVGQATAIPRGSRLSLRVGSTSGDLLYVAPALPTERIAVGRIGLSLPVLRRPVSR